MITFLALAFALQAAAAAPAAPPAAPQAPEELDRAAEDRVRSVEECVDTLDYFRKDLKAKKADLEKEFKGQIPSSFSNLINLKTNRIAKQQQACSKLITGADQPLDASMASARAMDGSSPAYAERRKKLQAQRERLNKALKIFAAAN